MSEQCCGNCKWGKRFGAGHIVQCNFPLPIWVKRELLNPLTGGGFGADQFQADAPNDCPTYEGSTP